MNEIVIGSVLDGRYELLELIGEGGMGQVFKARHNRLGKIFAIKSLRNLSGDPTEQAKFLEAFEDEAKILAELDHPALAKVSDFFEIGEVHFLVMEFIDGRTLTRVVELAPNNISQRRVIQWALELLEVLKYLHSRLPPVIVRDLKPDNIMIDCKRRLRLIDFGISKRLEPGVGTRDIVKGMGTAEYAPLEQYGSAPTDQRSDIYSLGGTLYFLLTETVPPPAWKRASEGAQPIPPSRLNATVTPEFEALLLRMMALRKEDRPESVQEVVEAISKLTGESDQSSPETPSDSSESKKVSEAGDSPRNGPSQAEEATHHYRLPSTALKESKTSVRDRGPAPHGSRPLNVEIRGCRSLRRYATPPQVVRYLAGGNSAAVAGRYLQVWDLNSEQISSKLWTGEQQLVGLEVSPDGKSLGVAEMEGEIRLYRLDNGELTQKLSRRSWGLFPDRVRDLCFLFCERRLAVASDVSNLRIFDLKTQEIVAILDWHESGLLSKLSKKSVCLAASRTGWLAAGGADGTVAIYESQSFKLKERKFLPYGELQAVRFTSDGQFLGCCTARGRFIMFSMPDLEQVLEIALPATPLSVAFSHDLRVIATGSSDAQVRLHQLSTGRELAKLSHHRGAVLTVDFSDCQPSLVSGGNDRRLYLTDLSW